MLGTWPHLSITTFPGASEGLGGGQRLGGHWGAAPSSAHAFMSFLQDRAGVGGQNYFTKLLLSPAELTAGVSSRQPIHLGIGFSLKQKISQG